MGDKNLFLTQKKKVRRFKVRFRFRKKKGFLLEKMIVMTYICTTQFSLKCTKVHSMVF